MVDLTRDSKNLYADDARLQSAIDRAVKELAVQSPIAKNSAGNGIYNGKFPINQKADITSPTAAVNNTVQIDMWKTYLSTVTGTITDLVGSIKFIATSTASGYIGAQQLVEDVAKYKGKTITVSCPVTSNSAQARIFVWDGSAVVVSDSHTGSGEEEDLTVTIKLSNSATALNVYATISTAIGGTVSITSGDYIEFADVRLDLGSHRLSGDREKGEELALCRRYWYQPESAATHARYGTGIGRSTTQAHIIIEHPELQDYADILEYGTISNLALWDGTTLITLTALSIVSVGGTKTTTTLDATVASGLTSGNVYQLVNNNSASGYLGLGNEP